MKSYRSWVMASLLAMAFAFVSMGATADPPSVPSDYSIVSYDSGDSSAGVMFGCVGSCHLAHTTATADSIGLGVAQARDNEAFTYSVFSVAESYSLPLKVAAVPLEVDGFRIL